MDEREKRAEERRRAGMFGEVIDTVAAPLEVAANTPEGRFAQLSALCARLFAFSGQERPNLLRSEYPGEVFRTTYGA